jgi:DNA-binding NtrC family response regulator
MNPNGLVYVVDDDVSVREGLASLVSSAGLVARTAGSGKEFLGMERPDVPSCLVLDIELPDLSGLELQQEFLKCGIRIPIIFLTGHGDIPMTVRALKAGAANFLTKPVDDEALLNAIRESMARPLRERRDGIPPLANSVRWHGKATDIDDPKQEEERLQKENVALREEIDYASMFEEVVGTAPALKKVIAAVSKVAPSDSTVLITGETGTGKELIARAIHKKSTRVARPFVTVNCAAIPQSLISSELFGHEKGAFTGAVQRRPGRFEVAEGGTIFLDEVGELPSETQIALLRVLQEREFQRVGGSQSIRMNVRVLAATNRDLQKAIAADSFRQDLFYRLNVFPIQIPPLRERREDIPVLIDYFIDRFARKAGKKIRGIKKCAIDLLVYYDWPGNIRELQNVIERAVILCDGDTLTIDETWLLQAAPSNHSVEGSLSRKSPAEERELIEKALMESEGRVSGSSGAAARLGIAASTLEYKIRQLKINKHDFKRYLHNA